jgi:hypothetical protein
MKIRLLPFVIVAMLFILVFNTYSQNETPLNPGEEKKPFYFGPVIGYNKVYHNVELLTFVDNTNLCNPFENGNANGFYAGLSFEYLIGPADKSQTSIIARVLYNSLPANLEREQDRFPSLFVKADNSDSIIYTSTRHVGTVKYNLLTFEVMYKLNPIKNVGFGITAGPTFDFPISKTIYQTYSLVGEPLNAQFYDSANVIEKQGYTLSSDGRTIIIKNGTIDNAAGFRLGLKVGVQYEIILPSKMYIVPAVYYNYGITKVTSTENWRVNAVQIGVDIRFAIKSLF